jgi:hypothetical protein
MGSVKTFGSSNGTALTLYKGYPTAKRASQDPNAIWEVVYRYWCQITLAESLLPAKWAVCPHPNHGTLILWEAAITENGKPGLCDVELTYKPPDYSGAGSTHRDTEVQKTSQASWQEVPLDDDRLVTSSILTASQVILLRKKGYQTWGMGTIEYSYTEWLSTFAWAEADLVAHIGNEEAPTGVTSPTSGKWLRVGLSIRTDGDLVERTKTWRYSRVGWKP